MPARVTRVRGFIQANYALISVALFALSLYTPASGYSGTYADVENCLAANPAPDGCYNYTQTSTNSDGQTVYTVYQRCGHVVAHEKHTLRDPKAGPYPCGYWPNLGINTCIGTLCLNDGGPGPLTYYSYMYQDTVITYCDGTSEKQTNYTGGGWNGLPFGSNPICVKSDTTHGCTDRLLCTIIIDPCAGSTDLCCRTPKDPCCGNPNQCCENKGGSGGK